MDKATIKRLQKELNSKKLEAERLQQDNSQLHARHSILMAYCDCLSWLRTQACSGLLVQGDEQQQCGLSLAREVDLSTAEELLLLQEMERDHPVGLLMQPHSHLQLQLPDAWCSNGCFKPGRRCDDWLLDLPVGGKAAAGYGAAWRQDSGTTRRSNSNNSQFNWDEAGLGAGPAAAAAGAGAAPWPMAATAAAGAAREEPTIAPADQVLHLFKAVYSMPQFPGALNMSLQDVAQVYKELVRELSLNLALHQAQLEHPPPMRLALPGGRLPLDNIRIAFDRYFNMIATFNQLQRNALLMSMGLVNYSDPTAELLQEPNLQEHIKYVRMVGLSTKQQHQIADGFAVFSRLLEPVLQAMRQLQLKQPKADGSYGSPAADGSGGNNSNGSSKRNNFNASSCSGPAVDGAAGNGDHAGSDGSSPADEATPAAAAPGAAAAAAAGNDLSSMLTAEGYKAYRENLHQQEQRASQMQLLMQKDMLIKAAFVCYTYGRFKYSQLAKLHVIMYPWQPNHATVVWAVMKIMEEGPQQQQQQQKQQQQQNQEAQQLLQPSPQLLQQHQMWWRKKQRKKKY